MLQFPVGLQLFSIRDDMAADFEGTLKKVKAMGYDGVEFAGLYGNEPSDVKRLCREIGLIPVSAHIPFVELMREPDKLIAAYKEIGCQQVVIPYLGKEYRPGEEKFAEVIEGAKFLGSVCQKYNMKLAYHNHDFEFVKMNGEYALDVLYEEVPAEILGTQIDTCWVNIAGENPADYIRKYKGRIFTVHLKDFIGQKSEKMYALIGIDDGKQKKQDAEQKFAFRPVGYGVQNFAEILKASAEGGASWVIVEQDEPSMDKTPLECAEMSIQYLKKMQFKGEV